MFGGVGHKKSALQESIILPGPRRMQQPQEKAGGGGGPGPQANGSAVGGSQLETVHNAGNAGSLHA